MAVYTNIEGCLSSGQTELPLTAELFQCSLGGREAFLFSLRENTELGPGLQVGESGQGSSCLWELGQLCSQSRPKTVKEGKQGTQAMEQVPLGKSIGSFQLN